MRRTNIKYILELLINSAAIVAAYKLGNNSGYDEGWNDGALAGACAKDTSDDNSSDITDFEEFFN